MQKAAKELGYHPFQAPAANMSETYTNTEGLTLGACEYCGHCERFGCEANAKASPQSTILPVLLPTRTSSCAPTPMSRSSSTTSRPRR